MADVAQLVRALDCGSGGRGFETHRSPHRKNLKYASGFFYGDNTEVLIVDHLISFNVYIDGSTVFIWSLLVYKFCFIMV